MPLCRHCVKSHDNHSHIPAMQPATTKHRILTGGVSVAWQWGGCGLHIGGVVHGHSESSVSVCSVSMLSRPCAETCRSSCSRANRWCSSRDRWWDITLGHVSSDAYTWNPWFPSAVPYLSHDFVLASSPGSNWYPLFAHV